MEKILIVNLLRLGDLVISTPVFFNLKLNLKNIKISALIRKETADILQNFPYIDKIYFYSSKLSLLKYLREFKKQDCVIFIMERDIFKLKFFYYLGIPLRIGYANFDKRDKYLTHPIKWDRPFEGLEKLFLEVLRPLKIDFFTKINPMLYISEKEYQNLKKILIADKIKIAIHTDTYAPSRKWPYFQQLIDIIKKETQNQVQIILSGKEKENFECKISNILDLRGKTTLSQLSALFKMVDLVVGCDTGAVHISRALGTKTIVIYGPEDPQIVISSENLIKIYPEIELECKNNNEYFNISFPNVNRCKRYSCNDINCLKSISPYKVWDKIKNEF
ncbi:MULTISPECIES: glycosyltransferase family 9 protein [Thermodesulfovibrio]|uniref:glycosyltransferase family 9 protein n=1 Tax=Thermodesulfovibrio yellowstonii TaxID=28262 RepID=UPI0004012297|nr:glycosyltransferase family 9 protein [Thermodesulfovibrio islandicus]